MGKILEKLPSGAFPNCQSGIKPRVRSAGLRPGSGIPQVRFAAGPEAGAPHAAASASDGQREEAAIFAGSQKTCLIIWADHSFARPVKSN